MKTGSKQPQKYGAQAEKPDPAAANGLEDYGRFSDSAIRKNSCRTNNHLLGWERPIADSNSFHDRRDTEKGVSDEANLVCGIGCSGSSG
jgi:hypothetical protein